jgi:hypothetical protein
MSGSALSPIGETGQPIVRNSYPSAELLAAIEPFVGVGPRRFFDLFSTQLGSGYPIRRKDESGRLMEWKPEKSRLRLQMLPVSYLDLEILANHMFREACERKEA